MMKQKISSCGVATVIWVTVCVLASDSVSVFVLVTVSVLVFIFVLLTVFSFLVFVLEDVCEAVFVSG